MYDSIEMKYFLLATFLLFFSCNTFDMQQKSNSKENQNIDSHKLSETEFENLKEYLSTTQNIIPKDTIIIKYEFNGETCWDMLDLEDDDYIHKIIDFRRKEIDKFNLLHKDGVAFRIREEGKNFNKVVSFDKTVLVDKSSFLRNLIFKEKNTCGNTVIILKDGKYYLRKGDPHFDIIQILNKSKRHD